MRLLLVEDEKSLACALETILSDKGCLVDTVYDGKEALKAAREGGYDAIVLDLMLPKEDGFSVLKKIRKRGDFTPILILSAKSEVEDRIHGLDYGADDYLTKPFDPQELWARIRAMTRRQARLPDSILSAGNTVLNRSTHELSSKHGNYILSNKEYRMMELLMIHQARMVTLERFREVVWAGEDKVDSSVIWTYISYLRKKLKALDSNLTIVAIRNTGYSLEVGDDA
ncbi:MAG: response regulator transcription factor [Eubacterium sp.]|nr:response regulator transcription factor [Eubacterium sp.]